MERKLRILILSQYYWPEGTRASTLAEGLRDRGHQVRVLTGFPNYPEGRLYDGYKMRPWQWEDIRDINVLRVPLFPDHSWSVVRRGLHYGSFALSASTIGLWLCGDADIMYVYHPPLSIGIPGALISKLRHIPMVYGVMDLWPESMIAAGLKLNPIALNVLSRLERWVYQQAVHIIVLSPGFKRNLVSKGVPAQKIEVVPVWGDESLYRPELPDAALAAEYGLDGHFNIIYGGNLGKAQALDTVVEAAALLQDIPEMQFVLIGSGVAEQGLRDLVAERGLSNVRFIGRQPPERMAHFYALGDVLLVHLENHPLFEITVPSKTMVYMACGRPVIMAVGGDAADVIRSAGAGVTCSSGNPDALAAAVRSLAGMSVEEREAMGEAGRQAFLQLYTSGVLIDRYEALFERLVKVHGSHS